MSVSNFNFQPQAQAQPNPSGFDFSQFDHVAPRRDFGSLNLTPEEIDELLNSTYGFSLRLLQEFPDLTTRAGKPAAWMKAFIVFEAFGRDTTYDEIAKACEVSYGTVYGLMGKVRKAVSRSFDLEIEHSGNRIYLVGDESLRERADRALKAFEKAAKAFERLEACVRSMRNCNQPINLPASAEIYLAAFQQARALEPAA